MRTNKISTTFGEINPDGPYQSVVSGNNLIYAYNDSGTLRIKYGDIKTPSAIDPETIITNGTQSYSKAGIWTGVDNGDRWIVLMRSAETANYLHCCFWTGNAGAHTLHYIRSADDGVTWAIDDEAFSPEDGFEVSDNQQIFNVSHINGTPYCVVYDQSTPRLTVYDVTDFSIVLTSDFRYTSGHYNETDDEFKLVRITVNGGNYEIRLFNFDGSSLTEEQEIDLANTDVINANEMHLSYCVRKFTGNSLILFIKANASVLCYIRPGDGVIANTWYPVTFTGTPEFHISWNDFSYMDIKYFHLSGSIDSIFLVNNKGYMVKISHEATATVSHGILWYMYPYNFEQEDQAELYDSKIFEAHLEPARLTLENIEESYTYQKGDGITVFDSSDLDGEIFIGEYLESESDLEGQFVKFREPSFDDLDREISVSFLNTTVSDMLIFILANYCNFLYNGDIDSTITTYSISWSNTKIKEIFKWIEEREFKIIYWNSLLTPIGYIYYNDGSGGLTSILENSGQSGDVKQFNLGKDFNGVILRGGMKQDGFLARLLVIQTVTDATQYNIFTVDVPQMLDDADGGEMEIYGKKLLSNRDSAFTGLRLEYYEKTKLPIGEGTLMNLPSYGINQNYIIYEQIYFPEENAGFIKKSYSGIFNTITSKETLSESNREILGQVAEQLNNIRESGTIYYLDSNASDVGGYKKLLISYASDVEEDIEIVNVQDGDLFEEFITEPDEPGITELLEGIYSVHLHGTITAGVGKNVAIYFEMYKRETDTTEILLGTSHDSDVIISADQNLETHIHLTDTIILASDRIVIKVYARVTGVGSPTTVQIHIQGDTTSRIQFPFQIIGTGSPFVLKAGDTMIGTLNMGGQILLNPLDPTVGTHVGDRDYNDGRYYQPSTDSYVLIAGDTMSGNLTISKAIPLLTLFASSGTSTILLDATSGTVANIVLNSNTNQDSYLLLQENDTNKAVFYYDASGELIIQTYDNEPIFWNIAATNKMRLNATTLQMLNGQDINLDTNSHLIHRRGSGGYLDIWGSDSSTDNKVIECVNDGILSVRGYHALNLGTNEGGAIASFIINTTAVVSVLPQTITKSINADFPGFDVINLNAGTAARARLRVFSDEGDVWLASHSTAYTGVSGWGGAGVLGTGNSGGLIFYGTGGLAWQISAGTNLMTLDANDLILAVNITTASGNLQINAAADVHLDPAGGDVVLDNVDLLITTHKTREIGSAILAFDEGYADNWNNVGPEYLTETDDECYDIIKNMILEPHETAKNSVNKPEFNCEHFPDKAMNMERAELQYIKKFVKPMMELTNAIKVSLGGEPEDLAYYDNYCRNIKEKDMIVKNKMLKFRPDPAKITKHDHGLSLGTMQSYLLKALKASIKKIEDLKKKIGP